VNLLIQQVADFRTSRQETELKKLQAKQAKTTLIISNAAETMEADGIDPKVAKGILAAGIRRMLNACLNGAGGSAYAAACRGNGKDPTDLANKKHYQGGGVSNALTPHGQANLEVCVQQAITRRNMYPSRSMQECIGYVCRRSIRLGFCVIEDLEGKPISQALHEELMFNQIKALNAAHTAIPDGAAHTAIPDEVLALPAA